MNNLPKGICLDHGRVQVRIWNDGKIYCKNFGTDAPYARELAKIHLAEKRKEILMGKFGITPEIPSKKFKDIAAIFLELWGSEVDASGAVRHSAASIYNTKLVIDANITPYFGKMNYDQIKPKDIQAWRTYRMQKVSGTTANRQQNVLSSIFSHVETWVKTEKIKAFKIPAENPCAVIERAPTKKRKRLLSEYEARKLKLAFTQLNDLEGWEICKLALKSVLSLKDLRGLEAGQIIDIERAKTGVPISLPINVLTKLSFKNWRKRWQDARTQAGISDIQFRDLRKTGINWLKGKHDLKLISEYAGHADMRTTESYYTVEEISKLEPLAKDLDNFVENI